MANYITDSMIHDIVLPYAISIAQEITSYSESVINAFYSHYTPKMYKRKYGLMGMWDTEMTPTERGYLIEITYAPEFFGASHNSDTYVFDGSFMQGYHGGPLAWKRPKKNIPQMSPSPWDLICQHVLTNYN